MGKNTNKNIYVPLGTEYKKQITMANTITPLFKNVIINALEYFVPNGTNQDWKYHFYRCLVPNGT